MRILCVKILILLTLVGCGSAPAQPAPTQPAPAKPAAAQPSAAPTQPAPTSAPATATAAPLPTATAAAKPTNAPSPTAVATGASTATAVTQPTAAPTSAATATAAAPAATKPSAAGEFVPKVRSIWNTVNGSNTTSGTCAGGAILPVYGLVEITPQGGDTLIWKSQEPQPYTFKKLAANQYQFKGQSGLGLGEQTMTVTFVNEKSLRMVHQLVPVKDPGCTHTFNYTGEYRWDRP